MHPSETIARAHDWLWSRHKQTFPNGVSHVAQILYCTVRELSAGELTLRAMSLVYTTLLSLAPLLALAFSIMKGLGVHNRIEPMLLGFLEPLGPSAREISETLIGFVDNIKIGVLGSIGVAMLFYTVLAMIQKVEASFNFIWKIPRQRTLAQRVSEYLVVLLLGPLAITLVLGVTASMNNNALLEAVLGERLLGFSLYLLGHALPYLIIIGIFSFMFAFVPNTRVKPLAALGGGLVSGLLWQSAAWIFANFVSGSANYNAVYSSFAILILLLIWMYLAWLILLIGCQISFFIQHPEYLTRRRQHTQAAGGSRDALILSLLAIVQQRFVSGKPGFTASELARTSSAPPDLVNPIINRLLDNGLLAETAQAQLLPAKDLGVMSLLQLLQAAETGLPAQLRLNPQAAQLGSQLDTARADVLGGQTLDQWLENSGQ